MDVRLCLEASISGRGNRNFDLSVQGVQQEVYSNSTGADLIMNIHSHVVHHDHGTVTKVPFLDLKAQYASIRGEIDGALRQVLDSAEFVGGRTVEDFEKKFAAFVGAKFAVGLSSGTSALELALKVAGIQPEDEVIVPANSFIATAEAASNLGARPVFVDVDPATFHLDVRSAETVITHKTRAIIPVHLYGRAMRLERLEEFAAHHRLQVIEDACQAHGVAIAGRRVGGSGNLTCYSFYPGKNLGAYGDAGAVTCSDFELAERLRLLRDHGSPAKYQHSLVGTNARLDSLQAAVLSVKLEYLPEWNRRRSFHARRYADGLTGSSFISPEIPPDGEHNYHLFVIRTDKRDALREYLQTKGVSTGIHYPIPIHRTQAYRDLGYASDGGLPVCEQLADEILSLPLYPELTESQVDYVVDTMLEFPGWRARASSEALAASH